MRIITINRQFGSGGREIGKRLSDLLGWDYYDKEIIESLSKKEDIDPDSIRTIVMGHAWDSFELTFRDSFSYLDYEYALEAHERINQQEVIRKIAEAGNDFIIVGQNADLLLKEYHPFRIFVCADLEARLQRCMTHEKAKPKKNHLTEKEILKNIKRMDKNRLFGRSLLSDKDKNDTTMYDLIVNAAFRSPKQLSGLIADFAKRWFDMEDRA